MKILITILLIIGTLEFKVTNSNGTKYYRLCFFTNIIALILLYLYVWR